MNTFTTPEKQGFRNFDLPTEHLIDERHYKPEKATDVAEIARRRELTPGTLRLEEQAKGLVVARIILANISEQEGLVFAADMLAAAAMNTAWYSYARDRDDVQRRELTLPIMLHPRNRVAAYIIEDSIESFGRASAEAVQLTEAHEYSLEAEHRRQRNVGVSTGNTALKLATYRAVIEGEFPVPQLGEARDLDDVAMQKRCRVLGTRTLKRARTLHRDIGSHPSIAQLNDPYSHLAVYWHRRAPASAKKAVTDALAA